jgi:histidinol dehydrogenase
MIRIVDSSNRKAVDALLGATRIRDRATETGAATIVEKVRTGGDRALRAYAEQYDGFLGDIEVPREEWDAVADTVPAPVRRAIRAAARAIRRVAKAQVPRGFRVTVRPGVTVEQRVIPLSRVGCYVPAGRYPLPSSLLMSAIPARAAGVPEVVVACPRPDATVFAAAIEAGVDRLFRVGGAHAVAALAYGTKTIPRVDKIVGPGNRWVSAAKSLVTADCAIDFYAGPTEILILAAKTPPAWVAADLIAQAEHDPDARAVCITTSRRLAEAVATEVALQMPSGGPAAASLWKHGGIIVAASAKEAMALVNSAASEHLVVETDEDAARVVSAGAVFVGPHTAQVAGDYAIGSNHVLPTAGAARFRGGLNAADFVKLVSVQRVTERGLRALAPTITTLARAEGLEGHARSIEVRTMSVKPASGRGETARGRAASAGGRKAATVAKRSAR